MSSTAKWATQRDAAAALKMSERSLQRLRNDGHLPAGQCWIRKIPANLNSHVIYDLAAWITWWRWKPKFTDKQARR